MNKEAEVQEEAVDIPVTDGSEEEAADTAQTAEEETSEEPAQTEETEQPDQEAESQKEPETKTKTSFFGKKKKEKDKFVTNQSRVTYARDKTNQIYYEQKQIFKDIIRSLHLHSLNLLRTKKRTETITSTLLEYTKRYVVWTR